MKEHKKMWSRKEVYVTRADYPFGHLAYIKITRLNNGRHRLSCVKQNRQVVPCYLTIQQVRKFIANNLYKIITAKQAHSMLCQKTTA